MEAPRLLKVAHLTHFSRPVRDRTAYRSIARHRPQSILEIGIGDGLRAARILGLAASYQPLIHYYGIDQFEGRLGGDGIPFKQAYRTLRQPQTRVQLIPGDPYSAMMRVANSLRPVDLVLVAADQAGSELDACWRYVPRVLAPKAVILLEESTASGEGRFRALTDTELQQLAVPARRAAA